MELEDTFASASAREGATAKEGDAKKKFGVAAAVLVLVVFVVFAASGPEEEAAAEADGEALMGATTGAVECSHPTVQAVLQSCGGSPVPWSADAASYAERRQAALAGEAADMVGSKIVLTELEQAADSLLRAARSVDLTDSPPLPSVHFFDAKPRYDAGRVLPIVRAVSARATAPLSNQPARTVPLPLMVFFLELSDRSLLRINSYHSCPRAQHCTSTQIRWSLSTGLWSKQHTTRIVTSVETSTWRVISLSSSPTVTPRAVLCLRHVRSQAVGGGLLTCGRATLGQMRPSTRTL
jgi:hypothetical protein